MKVHNKSYYKKAAWSAFSKYIRMKASDNVGGVNCYTCGKNVFWTLIQAGHAIGGRNNAILFNEDLVRPQCVGCNVFGRGKYAIFTRKLIDELSLARYDELITESQKVIQFKMQDYIDIETKYKKKLEEL